MKTTILQDENGCITITIEPTIPTLAQVLQSGNSAGTASINMNGNAIDNLSAIDPVDLNEPIVINAIVHAIGGYRVGNNVPGANATNASQVTVEGGIVTSAT